MIFMAADLLTSCCGGEEGGNWAAAARDLGLHRSNLHRRAQRIGLKPR